MAFFEGCPAGWGGGVPTGAGLVDGGVDQGPWLQERVGGGVGAMAVPKKGEGWGLVEEEQVREGVREGLAWRSGGDTHRSWPGGRGGRPRALIPGEGVRAPGTGLVDGGSVPKRRGQGRVGLAVGGGARASVAGG